MAIMASETELQALEENYDDYLVLQPQMRVEGYRFEPRRPQSPISSDDSSSEASDSDESTLEAPNDRLGNTDWCLCGECVAMENIHMCVCCHETDLIDHKRQERNLRCITQHPGFEGNCLNEDVVETSFYDFLADYGHVGDDEPIHKMYRHVAYRRFTRWIWHLLGKGVRKPIPACATHAIRDKWPSQEYTGFQYRRT